MFLTSCSCFWIFGILEFLFCFLLLFFCLFFSGHLGFYWCKEMWQREEGGKGTGSVFYVDWFLLIIIMSCVATECCGNLEVNSYTLVRFVSVIGTLSSVFCFNKWLETGDWIYMDTWPHEIWIESRTRTFFRLMQPSEDDPVWRWLLTHHRELSLADGTVF